MKPRQIVHSLLILSEAIIISCCLIMIIKYDRTSKKEKVWMGSKILTIKKELKKNNYELFPLLSIDLDGKTTEYKKNYESLLVHSCEICEENYKKCGILDTLGNIMCIPKEEECPINDIKVDLASNYNNYISQGYKMAHLENLTEEYSLYYTNMKTDREIIVKMNFSDEIPRYINKNNFIFDEDTYISLMVSSGGAGGGGGYGGGGFGGGGSGGGGGGGGGGVGSGGGGFRYLEEEYGDSKMTEYIKNKFNDDINIDRSFKNIANNLYVGNYIGFIDFNNMTFFHKFDLYESYFTVFPNLAADVLCYFSIVALIGLIIYSIIRFCHEDIPNEGFDPSCVLCVKFAIIIPYLTIFIGYFTYLLYEYYNIYKHNNPEDLKLVIAEEFIEYLLIEIYDRHLKEIFCFTIIILFSCSMFLFLLAWIISYIATKRYLKLLKIAKGINESF